MDEIVEHPTGDGNLGTLVGEDEGSADQRGLVLEGLLEFSQLTVLGLVARAGGAPEPKRIG